MTCTLYNTITKKHEPFVPNDTNNITFYSCGPTVYDDAHIGNFRSFLAADLLRRWLESPLCTLQIRRSTDSKTRPGPRKVTHVMNITDVGHMTEDHNADGAGQDKMELAAQRIKTSISESKKDGSLHKAAKIDPNDPRAIADFYETRFKKDAIALGLKVAIEAQSDPTLMPRASDHVNHMKQVITDLLNNNHAYTAGSPGARAIYFNTQSFPNYGQLSGNTLDHLKGGAGGRVDQSQQSEKKHPADFLLWKEDPSHKMKWPAPDHPNCEGWEEGYPGWHIECTAMALTRLVPGGLEAARANHSTIDLHSGGEDNIFPHHECEIAQSCSFTGNYSFANHWFHARFLKVEGQKMSKSKGTMYTLTDLTEKGIDPAAVRLELIKTHYRANADFSLQGLKDSAKQIERWRSFARTLINLSENENPGNWFTNGYMSIDRFKDALNNDLNIAKFIATAEGMRGFQQDGSIFDESADVEAANFVKMRKELSDTIPADQFPTKPLNPSACQQIIDDEESDPNQKTLATLHLIDNILGVIFRPLPKSKETTIALYQPGVTPSPEIESLLTQRAEAKKAKDFAAADKIRDQLTALNLTIMDKPGGKVEVAPAN